MAMISPVLILVTKPVPPMASKVSICLASARLTTAWIPRSIDRLILWPAANLSSMLFSTPAMPLPSRLT